MTMKRSIFFDEWQSCLRAHYIYVVRTNDKVTEPTLRSVLLHTGLTEDDIEALREQALALDPDSPPPESSEVVGMDEGPAIEESLEDEDDLDNLDTRTNDGIDSGQLTMF